MVRKLHPGLLYLAHDSGFDYQLNIILFLSHPPKLIQEKLNPVKYASGKFLGFMVLQRGIEANLEKLKIIQQIKPPRSIKGVQELTGRVAAFNMFISRSADKCLPFFKTLWGANGFQRMDEVDHVFEQLKEYLASPPQFAKPITGEPPSVYLETFDVAVSVVLVKDEKGVQRPVYYISTMLTSVESRYPPLDKAVYALVMAARKSRPYFQVHPIKVLTTLLLMKILHGLDMFNRMLP